MATSTRVWSLGERIHDEPVRIGDQEHVAFVNRRQPRIDEPSMPKPSSKDDSSSCSMG